MNKVNRILSGEGVRDVLKIEAKLDIKSYIDDLDKKEEFKEINGKNLKQKKGNILIYQPKYGLEEVYTVVGFMEDLDGDKYYIIMDKFNQLEHRSVKFMERTFDRYKT